MNIFDYDGDEFDKKLDELLKDYDEEKLMKELMDAGLKVESVSYNVDLQYEFARDIISDFSIHNKSKGILDRFFDNKNDKEVKAA